jgi:hypothetical protein
MELVYCTATTSSLCLSRLFWSFVEEEGCEEVVDERVQVLQGRGQRYREREGVGRISGDSSLYANNTL